MSFSLSNPLDLMFKCLSLISSGFLFNFCNFVEVMVLDKNSSLLAFGESDLTKKERISSVVKTFVNFFLCIISKHLH